MTPEAQRRHLHGRQALDISGVAFPATSSLTS